MNKKNYQVGFLITGDAKKGVKATELTRDALKDLNKQQKKTAQGSKGLTSSMGGLFTKFGAVTGVIGTAAAALGGMSAVMRTQTITEMKVMADTLDISTQALSEWSTAGAKFNVGNEKMVDIFKDLQDKIGDFAATGGGEAKDIFEKLNLDINEFVGLGADEQLLKIGTALDGVASHSEKIFYMEALANDASRLLPLLEDGAKGLRAAQVEARLLGTSIDDVDAEMIAVAGREFQRTGDVVTGLGNTITAKLAPALGGMNDGIADIVIGFGGWEGIVDNVIESMLSGIGFVADNLNSLAIIIKTGEFALTSLGIAGLDALKGIGDTGLAVINGMFLPFKSTLSILLNMLSKGLGALGRFTGNDAMVNFSKNIKSAQESVSGFNITIDGLDASKQKLIEHQGKVFDQIQTLQNAKPSEAIEKWHKNITKAAKDNATATVEVKEAQRALGKETAATQKALIGDEYTTEIDKLIEGADSFSSSWSNAGNVIVDTFGSIGQQLDKMSKSQKSYAKELEKLGKLKIKYKDDPAELQKLAKYEEDLATTRTVANLSSYASIAGAASQMFDEQSKGRKVLHNLELAFTAVEIALSIKKASANALAAISNQGNGDPYTAFARIAAMAAIMGGLGLFSGSVSGASVSSADRQQNQGTGTVFGDSDAKSDSLNQSFERIEELELDQYAELQAMNTELKSLNSNISHLAVSLVGGYGKFDQSTYNGDLSGSNFLDTSAGKLLRKIDPAARVLDLLGLGDIADKIFGGFSKTKKTIIDSGISIVGQTLGEIIESGVVNAQAYYDIKTKKSKFWGLSSKTKYATEYQNIDGNIGREFALIFENIGSTITEAVDILGLDIAKESNTLADYLNDFGALDIDERALDALFNNINNSLGEAAARSLDNFQINLPNISFKDLSGEEIEAELQAIFSNQADLMTQYLVPQIAEFQKVGEGLYETLIRVSQEQVIFNSAMDAIGHSLADLSKQAQTAIAQTVIELVGGLENFREYTSTYFSEFFSEEEQFAYLESTLTQMFAGLEQTLPATREEFKALIDGIDLTTESGQALYAALMSMVGSLDQYYDTIESGTETVDEALVKEQELAAARQAFNSDIAKQLNELDMTPLELALADLEAQFDAYRAEAEEFGADTTLLEELYSRKRNAIIENALEQINASHEQSVNRLTADHDKFIQSLGAVNASIATNILSIRRGFEGWDEVGYQNSQVNTLRSQLGQGSAADKLSTIDKLNDALWNKYNAEIDHNKRLSDLANERYNNEVSRYEDLLSIANELKDAANNLQFGALSPFSKSKQFGLAQSQFNQVRASGDISGLRSAGENYLNLASEYYGGTASSDYEAIFNEVTQAFKSADVGAGPVVPSEVLRYQEDNLLLGQNMLLELEQLRELTDELERDQQDIFEDNLTTLNDELANQTLSIEQGLVEQTNELTSSIGSISTAIESMPAPVVNVPAPVVHLPPPVAVPAPKDNQTPPTIEIPENKELIGRVDKLIQATERQRRTMESMEVRLAEGNTNRAIA